MRTTTFKCDRCSAESTNPDDLNLEWVGVGVKKEKYSSYSGRAYELGDGRFRQKEMCKKCREELGLHDYTEPKEGEPAPTYPTLEEMIREIIREEIQER